VKGGYKRGEEGVERQKGRERGQKMSERDGERSWRERERKIDGGRERGEDR
jgi:hypothetical protein